MTIGIAVIGAGRWGPNYVRILRSMADVRVVAAVDPSPDARRKMKAAFPDLECDSDLQKALAKKDVDAVVVATPTSTHHEVVKAALKAGKHVLCEKPLAASGKQAWELVRLAGTKNLSQSAQSAQSAQRGHERTLMAGHVFLFNPGIEYLQKAAAEKDTGPIYYINAVRTNLGPFRSDVNAAWDLASHDIYIINAVLGKRPESVSAAGASFLRKPVEDIAFLTLRYPGGVLGHVHISWLDPRKVRQITLVGEKRMITWDEFGAPGPIMIYDRSVVKEPSYNTFGEFQLLAREGDVMVPRIKSAEPLAAQAKEFIQRCLGKSSDTRGSAAQGAEVVDVLEAASRSMAENGAFVPVKYGG